MKDYLEIEGRRSARSWILERASVSLFRQIPCHILQVGCSERGCSFTRVQRSVQQPHHVDFHREQATGIGYSREVEKRNTSDRVLDEDSRDTRHLDWIDVPWRDNPLYRLWIFACSKVCSSNPKDSVSSCINEQGLRLSCLWLACVRWQTELGSVGPQSAVA